MSHDKPVFPLPREGELVAFQHGAAGHQGISSNASGELIIKPCTQAEIDFYEAAKEHPEFQALMPVFIGKLQLGEDAAIGALSPKSKQAFTLPIPETVPQPEPSSAKVTLVPVETSTSEKGKEKEKPKAWIPSGGKKLETGLAIVLENAAAAFKKPNVIDLKLGSRLWDDNAVEAKRARLDEVASRTTSGSLGFRIAGAKIWLGSMASTADVEVNTSIKDGYKCYDKNYGQKLDEQSVQQAIARFLAGSIDPTVYGGKTWFSNFESTTLTKRLIKELENIQHVLEHEESRMYSASVLVVIEGDQRALEAAMKEEKRLEEERATHEVAGTGVETERTQKEAGNSNDEDDDDDDEDEEEEEEEEEDTRPRVMEIRLIDFAHAKFTPGQGPDENALKGIRNIIETLQEISK